MHHVLDEGLVFDPADLQTLVFSGTTSTIVGQDDPSMLQKWKVAREVRLLRLRWTLRSNAFLAAHVKTLHVPDPHIPIYLDDDNPNPDYDAYLCTLASVVMECPNLEALTGFVPFYNHTFDRLTHALSTRHKLREHVWVIAENEDVAQRCKHQTAPGLLSTPQTFEFTLYHRRWRNLDTLVLCSPGSLGVLEHQVLVDILHSLPSLAHLCISSLDADDFHDQTLVSLPAIKSLRLEECGGVTDLGLTRWAASPAASQIERLSLHHQGIADLLTISKVLACLERLIKFTIVQSDMAPSLPEEANLLVVQPVLASPSLQWLHWDIAGHSPRETPAATAPAASTWSNPSYRARPTFGEVDGRRAATPNCHLAMSIVHQGFPSLRHLRAPRDTAPPGLLQSVCQPLIKGIVLLPGDIDRAYDTMGDSRPTSLGSARLRALKMAGDLSQTARRRTTKHRPTQGFPLTACQETASSPVSPMPFRTPLESQRPSTNSSSSSSSMISEDPGSLAAPILPPRSVLRKRPVFHLGPDVLGYDDNGGLVGWGELLGIREKARLGTEMDGGASGGPEGVHDISDSDEELRPSHHQRTRRMCTGESRCRLHGKTARNTDALASKEHLASSSSTSVHSIFKSRSRPASTSFSFLRAPKPKASTSWKHVARPRGTRGGCVTVQDFF